MTLVYLELAGLNIQDTPDIFPVGHWDGYAPPLPQAFSQGTPVGNNATWGGTILPLGFRFLTVPYAGYTTNYGATPEPVFVPFQAIPYVGYTTNYGGKFAVPTDMATTIDLNSVIEFPKTQFIYYKLKGFNTTTHAYEIWVIKEDITSRPELFDPGRAPPTIERDVFRVPPTGDALVNITIVARWIQ